MSSKTISFPALIECWREEADRSSRDHVDLARNCVWVSFAIVCCDPDLQERAVDQRQLKAALRKVQKNNLWGRFAKEAADIKRAAY